MRLVSAANANRAFSKILHEVREGETVMVTSHGKPVAVIGPVSQLCWPERESAKAVLLARLRAQMPVDIMDSDELHEG